MGSIGLIVPSLRARARDRARDRAKPMGLV